MPGSCVRSSGARAPLAAEYDPRYLNGAPIRVAEQMREPREQIERAGCRERTPLLRGRPPRQTGVEKTKRQRGQFTGQPGRARSEPGIVGLGGSRPQIARVEKGVEF